MKNAICWFDIPVKDLETCTKFYEKVMGVSLARLDEHGFKMSMFPHQENSDNVAGCLFEDKNAVPNTSNMLMYFDVDGRIKDAVEQVTQNHGKVINNIEAIGPWGYRAIVSDCEGNKIALWSRTA